MSALAIVLAVIGAGQGGFDSFSFCRAGVVQGAEVQCLELSQAGEGLLRFEESGDDPYERPLQLTTDALERFLGLVEATDYLREGDRYESAARNVASLGLKTLTVEGDWGRREAVFNYSSRAEVTNLMSFLERLIVEEQLLMDIEIARQFDPLSMPEFLERMERDLSSNRFVDAARFLPVLEEMLDDRRLLLLVRNQAAELFEEIEDQYVD